MSILSNGLAAVAMVTTLAATSVVPAQAQSMSFSYGQRDRVITSYCDAHRRDPDCRRWHGGGWRDSDYNNFYRRRGSDLDSIAAGLFGFGFGAILGGAIANSNNNSYNRDRVVGVVGGGSYSAHVQACFNRYRSYDERTDSFMGYDGVRHSCNL